MTIGAVLIAAALMASAVPARAHDGPHEIAVRNNSFDAQLIEVDPGDRLTWTLVEGIHTVTGDLPGSFRSGRMEEPGSTFEATMPATDAWVYYHCTVHGSPGEPPGEVRGAGMFGVIRVGNPPPPAASEVEVRPVPSTEWPTLWSALGDLADSGRYVIELAPGTYSVAREGSRVDLNRSTLRLGLPGRPLPDSFSLTLRGDGTDPSRVVLEGGVTASNITGFGLANLSIRDAPDQGVLLGTGAERWNLENVIVQDTGSFGVRVHRGARRGGIIGIQVTGASVAGISIEDCEECDVLIKDVVVRDSLQGIAGLNAGAITVFNSVLSNNGVGIALKTSVGDRLPARGASLLGNTIVASTNRSLDTPSPSERLDLPVGAGVWLAGASFALVRGNAIDTASFGVVVTGPAYENRILDNIIANAVEADLAWDGLGARVCFEGNTAPAGQEPSTMPPAAQTLYACDLPAVAGIPYPLVDARVLAWGFGSP